MSIDIDEFAAEVFERVKGELSEGWDDINNFRKSQLKKLSRQAVIVGKLRVEGELTGDTEMFEFFLEQLEDKVENLAIAVANLTVLTLQRAWNAIVGVFWGAINEIVSGAGLAGLPIPALRT